jgi:hypothetical protein
METKTKLGGFAGAKVVYPIEDEKSPFRIPASDLVTLVINRGEVGGRIE